MLERKFLPEGNYYTHEQLMVLARANGFRVASSHEDQANHTVVGQSTREVSAERTIIVDGRRMKATDLGARGLEGKLAVGPFVTGKSVVEIKH